MEFQPASSPVTKVSIQQITEDIRIIRNAGIEELLKGDGLLIFLETQFDTVAISPVKAEFLKRELSELRASPLDLAFYSSMITMRMNTPYSGVLSGHSLFLSELLTIFKKYGFHKT